MRRFASSWRSSGSRSRSTGRRRIRTHPEQLDVVRRWYAQDWLAIDPKLRSSIIEGLSVFLSVCDLPDVAATFCPPKPATEPAASPAAPGADTAAIARPPPPLDEVMDNGKVLCLNMPAATNPPLSRAVGVLLKQAWLQTRGRAHRSEVGPRLRAC